MAGQSSAMFGWSWTEVSVLGSQVSGQALMESSGVDKFGCFCCLNRKFSTKYHMLKKTKRLAASILSEYKVSTSSTGRRSQCVSMLL